LVKKPSGTSTVTTDGEQADAPPTSPTNSMAPIALPGVAFGKKILKKFTGTNEDKEKQDSLKLVHITKSRPTMANRRPPSSISKILLPSPPVEEIISPVSPMSPSTITKLSTKSSGSAETLVEETSPVATSAPSLSSEAASTKPATSFADQSKLEKINSLENELSQIINNSLAVSPPNVPGNKPKKGIGNTDIKKEESSFMAAKSVFATPAKDSEPFKSLDRLPSPTMPKPNAEQTKKALASKALSANVKQAPLLGPILLPSHPQREYSTTELYKIFYDELLRFREEINEKFKDYDQLRAENIELRKRLDK
jgi:hypothetical protein